MKYIKQNVQVHTINLQVFFLLNLENLNKFYLVPRWTLPESNNVIIGFIKVRLLTGVDQKSVVYWGSHYSTLASTGLD